ncbi:MAG: acyl-CoA dehydrogenase family protein [Candidatus Binatia bacterium]|jgi:hypothetical protein
MNLEIIRSYCYQLLELVRRGKGITRQAAMAKLFASRMKGEVRFDYGYLL